MQNSIKAVIWDMGGVILRTKDDSKRAKWAKKLNITTSQLCEIVFDNEISNQATIGEKLDVEIWEFVRQQFKLNTAEIEVFIEDFWAGDQMDVTLLDYIDSLRGQYITALLSNAWVDARENITKRFPGWNRFDLTIFSSEIHLAKPDPRIFNYALQKIKISSSEAIFIDDMAENIKGAIGVGMRGIQFLSTQQAIHDVEALLKSRNLA